MNARIIIAVLVGGVTGFVWSSISWMVIPWHQPTMSIFETEEVVGAAIKEAAPAPGIYTYPGWTDDNEDMEKKHAEGPYVFASVVPAGVGDEMGSMMIGGLLVNIVGAAVLLILIRMVAPDSNWKVRACVASVAALFVSLVPALMNWNWWHFPVGFTVVGIIDNFIAWSLVGLVMALIISPRSAEGS